MRSRAQQLIEDMITETIEEETESFDLDAEDADFTDTERGDQVIQVRPQDIVDVTEIFDDVDIQILSPLSSCGTQFMALDSW